MKQDSKSILSLFPLGSGFNRNGHLTLGGIEASKLVERYGTPLYVFDEATIRSACREFLSSFQSRYRPTTVNYASKAFLNRPIASILNEEGMGLDIVSGGELSIARAVSFPAQKIFFNGNNKTEVEIRLALEMGIGRFVVDNLYELETLDKLASEYGIRQNISIRLNPGVDAHSHRHTTTAILDSKFGLPITNGQAEEAVTLAAKLKNVKLIGFHFHLGSPVAELSPYREGLKIALGFAREMRDRHSLALKEISLGGGFAVPYTLEAVIPTVADYAEAIVSTLKDETKRLGLPQLHLGVEPGRYIIAKAGVALYRTGAIKDIPGVRKYACIDGGMGDNIRPALYDAKYEALVANRGREKNTERYTIAGKYCESGDILIRDIMLPRLSPGDILAVPVAGAYAPSMASNYNAMPRPAIVMVKDGKSRLIRRRESYADLMRLDRNYGRKSG